MAKEIEFNYNNGVLIEAETYKAERKRIILEKFQ